MKRYITYLIFTFIVLINCSVKAQNPFKQYGYNPRVLTLSGGKFAEHIQNDTLMEVGSVVYNMVTKKVVGFITKDTLYSEATAQPEVVSRWISPDPLAEKYPALSPYDFVGGNPINRVDKDGRDWDIVINHENQTITIRAQFFTTPGVNTGTLLEAANNWNSQSGKFSYVIGKGDNAVSYAVNFNITVSEMGDGCGDMRVMQNDNGSANNMANVLPDNNKHFAERKDVDDAGNERIIRPVGVSNGYSMVLKDSQKEDAQKTAHEMGHNLGMRHSSGLMGKEGGKNLGEKSVHDTLGQSGIMTPVKSDEENKAQMQSKEQIGTAPANFQDGRLQINRSWNGNVFGR